MSPRIKRNRKVLSVPIVKGFKPYGPDLESKNSEPVILLFEEYEALRLCDYDMITHLEASAIMNISRPTYTRIYAAARQKIAKAFVEGRQIAIEGGKVYFDSEWSHCCDCGCFANNPHSLKSLDKCPLCGSSKIQKFDNATPSNDAHISFESNKMECVCPKCGYQHRHQKSKPCNLEVCPQCNTSMRRKCN